MKKKFVLIGLVILELLLGGLGLKAFHQPNPNIKKVKPSTVALIRQNQRNWQRTIRDADNLDIDGQVDSRGYIAYSLPQLKEVNDAVIKGTVLNLEKINNPNNIALTKVSIKIEKVISGEQSLKNKTITVAMNGGVTTFNKWYAGQPSPKDEDHKVLIKYDEYPLPEIGSQVITGLLTIKKDEPSDYNQALKQNNFNLKKTYALGMPEFNLWIKKSTEKKFHLNNPLATKKLVVNPTFDKGINKLTEELNQN